MIVCDTGPIVALSNHRDAHHFTANNPFRDLHMAGESLLLPPTVLAETCYWLNEHGGDLMRDIRDGEAELDCGESVSLEMVTEEMQANGRLPR